MLKGTGVSAGIGIGRLLLVENELPEYRATRAADTGAEIKRLKDALEQFCQDTEKQAQALLISAGEAQAEIMRGHIAIAKDPVMQEETEKLISSGQCAEASFAGVCDMFIQIFSATNDDITMQRAEDIRDVKTEVLGILSGVDTGALSHVPAGTILCTRELTPSMLARINRENIEGILTETGSTTSHSAILARVMEIPAVMSLPGIMEKAADAVTAIIDGSTGDVILSPDKEQTERYTAAREKLLQQRAELEKYRGKATVSADGIKYKLFCNIGKPEDAIKAMESDGEGVGLFRTEFLFMDRTSAPTEEEQFSEYKRTALILQGKPLIIRTLDVGGDKDIPYLGLPREDNPFMGLRAIRYCLKNRELFRTQLRAILRASAFGNVSIMFPMITCVEELREGRAIIEELKRELRQQGTAFDENIPVGIMAETAASGVIADLLAKEADFFSIGTNDLTGYTMAADRGNSDVSYLYSPLQPGVLRMIRAIIRAAADAGIPAGMCGEAAADPMMIPLLLSFGLTEFSVSPPKVLSVRKHISSWTKQSADELTAKAMSLATQREIEEYLRTQTQYI